MQKRETWWWNTTYSPGGNSQEKEDVQEVENNRKHKKINAAYKEAKREAKRTVAVERARSAQ